MGWSGGHKTPDFGAHCDQCIIFDAMNHVQGRIRNVKEYHCAIVDAVRYPLVLPVIENIRSGATSGLIFPDAYKEEFFRVMDECVVADGCLRVMSIRTPPPHSLDIHRSHRRWLQEATHCSPGGATIYTYHRGRANPVRGYTRR